MVEPRSDTAATSQGAAPELPEGSGRRMGAAALLGEILRTLAARGPASDDDSAPAPTAAPQARLGDIVDLLDERAFGLLLLLLALPCCLPFVYLLPQIVALPMLALAAQLAAGRSSPWLPAGLARRRFDIDGFLTVLGRAERYLSWVERVAHPRLFGLSSRVGARLVGGLLMVPCASILVPLPGTNTIPGIGVAIAAVGLIERDGVLIVGGVLIGLLWVAALLVFGLEAASIIKGFVAARF